MTQAGALFYGELAPWWPLISPVDEYEDDARFIRGELEELAGGDCVRVLELGCGGGHTAHHLAPHWQLTLVDLSAAMLAQSQRINAEAHHVVGDMRTVDVGSTFDAVFVHDAIDYMVRLDDLRAVVDNAARHLRPGGALLLLPDDTRETFQPSTDCSGSDAPDGRGARLLEWTYDPDPTDCTVLTEYVFVLRQADGAVLHRHESHETGLYSQRDWLEILDAAGFEASARPLQGPGFEGDPRIAFVGRKR